jgi:hypothetical protein
MQTPSGCGDTERVVARLLFAVSRIIEQQKGCGEKDLLCLAGRHIVALALASVAGVPVELGNLRQADHWCIL